MSSNGEDTEPSSPRPGSSSDCECKVCFATPARTHFGATTCRPCAAFFRRAVVLKKQYKCGLNGDCPITKTVRVICPFCRYKKCLKVGMKIENIRFNFDKTGPKRRSPSYPLQTKKKSILDEMTLGYKKFIEETQNLYYALNPESLFDKTLEFRPGTLNDCLQFERAQFVYVLKMLNEHFQPFGDFSDEEKRQIFEIFQYPFGHLNRLYLNSLYFRADDSKLLLNLGIYAQADCFTHFYSNDRHPHASAQIFKPFQIKVVKIAKKFKNIRIDAVETAALAGIILWRDLAYYLDCSDYDHLVDQINHELYEYCKRKDGNREVGTRFGLVLSVLRGIEDMMTMNKENIVVLLLTGDHLHRPFADITALGTR